MLTASEVRLTKLSRKIPLKALGINDGYQNNEVSVEKLAYADGRYRYTVVAADCFGRILGPSAKSAERALRALV